MNQKELVFRTTELPNYRTKEKRSPIIFYSTIYCSIINKY